MVVVINTIQHEFPSFGRSVQRILNRDPIADFPSEALCQTSPRDGSLAIFHKCIPFIIGYAHLGHNQALIFRVNDELREKVLFVLINAAEPVVMSDSFDALDLQNLVAVRKRNHIDQSRAINHHQAISPGQFRTAAERTSHYGEKGEQEERYRERSDRQNQSNLLAEQICKYKSVEFHATPPTSTPLRAPSTKTPLSRCNVVCARAATRGSCVTISTVLWYLPTSSSMSAMISSALFRSRSPVGSSHSRKVGSETMARAIVTRCSCPPESCRGKWFMRSDNPTTPSAVSTCLRRSDLESLVSKSGSSTF